MPTFAKRLYFGSGSCDFIDVVVHLFSSHTGLHAFHSVKFIEVTDRIFVLAIKLLYFLRSVSGTLVYLKLASCLKMLLNYGSR